MNRVLGFDSQQGLEIFLFITSSRMALGLTQPPIPWVPGVLSMGVKQPGCEADHSSPSSAKVKEYVLLYLQYTFMAWSSVKRKSTGTTLPLLFIPLYLQLTEKGHLLSSS
jgi:hypothetical protein